MTTRPNKPALLTPCFANIPEELQSIPRWVLWKLIYDQRDDRWTKPPFDKSGRLINATDPSSWQSFTDVTAAHANGGNFDGIGFVLDGSDNIVGIDPDHIDEHRHQPEVQATYQALMKSRTYVEWSPSGAGVRAFLRGKLPFDGRNNRALGIELYGAGRYLTVTGHRRPRAALQIVESQETIKAIVARVFPEHHVAPFEPTNTPEPTASNALSDVELLDKARNAKNGKAFGLLWAGKREEYYLSQGKPAASQSEADLALCSSLAFWTGKDAKRMDRLFRQSGLMRPKWDQSRGGNTYGELTMAKAISLCTDVYAAQPAKSSGLEVVPLDKVIPQTLEWLWPGFFPLGKVSLLSGNPGLGKSQITLDIAARVSRGSTWPTGEVGKRGRVLLVCGEDDAADTIVPRLQAAGADLSRIKLIKAVRETDATGASRLRSLSLERDLERLALELRQDNDVTLVIIDPISAYLGKIDSHKNAEIRALMEPVCRLAQEHRVAVVLVSHLNKGSGEAIYRTAGSIGFVAVARASFAVLKDDSNPGHRLMLPIKTNLGPDIRGIGYEIKEAHNKAPYVAWDKHTVAGEDIESLMQQSLPGEGGKLREAMDWLKDKLSIGPVPAAQIVKDAKKDGIAERTLERAKQKLGAKAYAGGGRWEWGLPPPQLVTSPQLGPLQQLGPPPIWVTTFPFSNL